MPLAAGTASAGFLDSLFHVSRQPDTPAALPYADAVAAPRVATPSVDTPRESGSGSGGVATFCVRLCDGRYFPIQRLAGATPVQTCSAFCPAAKTRIFTGSEISHASASDGARYASLENAFVYRQKIVPGCTCNGRDAFGLAPVDVANDPTLRAGDMVATQGGLQKFTGSPARQEGAGFTPAQAGGALTQHRRIATTGAASAD
jgi:hypothetical protein